MDGAAFGVVLTLPEGEQEGDAALMRQVVAENVSEAPECGDVVLKGRWLHLCDHLRFQLACTVRATQSLRGCLGRPVTKLAVLGAERLKLSSGRKKVPKVSKL